MFRAFLGIVAAAGALPACTSAPPDVGKAVAAAQSPQTPLPGSAIPQFQQELPVLSASAPPPGTPVISTVYGNQPLTIRMCEFDANVLPAGTPLAAGAPGTTRVWGYVVGDCPTAADPARDTYIGPVIVNDRGSSTDVTWVNELGDTATTGVLAYKYSTDQTLHWADPLSVDQGPTYVPCSMLGGIPEPESLCAKNYQGPIPAVVHLHGGEVPPELDGGPDAWFTSSGGYQGPAYYSLTGADSNEAIYRYPNTQEAAPIWFHDHTLGATRLNVYAGLAGAYFIQDPDIIPERNCQSPPCLPAGLTPLEKVVPLIIQDRSFDTNGELLFPSDSLGGILWTPNPEHPYWVPEFVGDAIAVNGKVWPYLNVEAKRYRFLFLNGSNARTYEMSIPGGPTMWVIGTDGGYLDAPVPVKVLTMMPGERYEVIMDFAGLTGKRLILKNTGRTPFPKGAPPQGSTVGRILQFRVGVAPAADDSYDPAGGTALRPVAIPPLVVDNNTTHRQLTLNEVLQAGQTAIDPVTGATIAYPGGPLEILVNNTKWSGMSPRHDIYGNEFTPVTLNGNTLYYSELPTEGTTEVWEIINLTADAHPIHLHLVQFQLMNRQNFNLNAYNKAYAAKFPAVPDDPVCTGGVFCPGFGPPLHYYTGNAAALGGNPNITPFLQGKPRPPEPYEAGWKDTVIMYPGQVTRIIVRWAPTDAPATALYYPFEPQGTCDPDQASACGYVWHCHIIDHEDNEMMRPDLVEPNPGATRTLQRGTDY